LRGSRGAPPLDRRSEILRIVVVGLAFALAACASAPEATAPVTSDSLRALRWIAPQADAVKALTVAPIACEPAPPKQPTAKTLELTLGRIAFESPALLGGAAARMGLSCSSCHINGRGNADFFIAGVSGAPGTADVTSSLFSKVRGNGAFDPVPIPDLATREGGQISDRKSKQFEDKIRGLIVEEFDGQPPPAYVFEAVLAYLDSLDVAHCVDPSATVEADYAGDYAAVISASTILRLEEAPADAKLFYIRAARERLERLHERFIGKGEARAQLEELSALFAQAADGIRAGSSAPDLSGQLARLGVALVQESERSLYSPDVLRTALDP
jgi:hypothetical protein